MQQASSMQSLRLAAAARPTPRAGTGRAAPLRVCAQQQQRPAVAAVAAPPKRAYNFSAGPAVLPLDVLQTAQAELLDWHGSGMSVLEMSHRGPEFESIIAKAEKDLRALMQIPDNYKARARPRGAFASVAYAPRAGCWHLPVSEAQLHACLGRRRLVWLPGWIAAGSARAAGVCCVQ